MPEHLVPTLREGFTLTVIRSDGVSNVRIKGMRGLPSHEHDFGALTAGTASTRQECTHLELESGQLAEYWVRVRDQFELEILHPRATNFFATKLSGNTVGANWRVRPFYGEQNETPELLNFRLESSKFWVWQDDTPLFDLYPFNSAQNPQGHVEFVGWRYSFEEIPESGQTTLRVDKFD